VKIRETLLRLNRIQQTTPFKIIASVVVVALAIAAFATYYVAVTAPAARETAAMREEIRAAEEAAGQPQNAEDREMRSALDASQKVFEDIAARRASPVNVGIGAAAIAGMMIAAIWLGLGLTYLALALLTAVVIFPLWRIGGTTWAQQREWSKQMSLGQAMRAVALLGTGLVILTASFVALMQAGRSFLAGPNQVFAIARNVLIEAVRIKVFLVLIIVLVFALAALPLVLDPTTPLRYRVQSFLQYGTGGAFWIIAFLTLFFSASTVAFEQRDRQIWQTMTKPVAAWQYLLGKWLGVVTLNAVLLAVCCAGVFLFTEYLRKQPAEGEQVQVVAGLSQGISRDRMLLETQVLAARERVTPADPMEFDSPDFQRGVAAYIEDQRSRDPDFARDDTTFRQVASDLHKSYVQNFRSIRAGAWAAYEFTGLQEAKRRNVPLTLRYKVDSGSNDPSHIYKLTFSFAGQILPPQDVGLGQAHTLTLYPNVIDDAGVLTLEVVNGALVPDENGALAVAPNPDMIVFPKDGLELFYAAGSYQGNFLRVAGVLWVKLAFLSMLAIAASTFLSFPVACLIAFSVFLGAEGAGYLKNSLEYYSAADEKGNINPIKVVIRAVGLAVSWMFASYHDLKPTMRLVDGRLLTWSAMSYGSFVLLAWTAALFGLAVGIFRKRELATYSGH
jgi:ABC-type transport system involved in multi-copper enzyme maturation permease subunit